MRAYSDAAGTTLRSKSGTVNTKRWAAASARSRHSSFCCWDRSQTLVGTLHRRRHDGTSPMLLRGTNIASTQHAGITEE